MRGLCQWQMAGHYRRTHTYSCTSQVTHASTTRSPPSSSQGPSLTRWSWVELWPPLLKQLRTPRSLATTESARPYPIAYWARVQAWRPCTRSYVGQKTGALSSWPTRAQPSVLVYKARCTFDTTGCLVSHYKCTRTHA